MNDSEQRAATATKAARIVALLNAIELEFLILSDDDIDAIAASLSSSSSDFLDRLLDDCADIAFCIERAQSESSDNQRATTA